MMTYARLISIVLCVFWLLPASASELVDGPVKARVLRVIDGDTFEAEALVWPGHRVRVAVRIRGIDAPELRSRCRAEKRAAMQAKAALERLMEGRQVVLSHVGGGKYYGRVLADAAIAAGPSIAEALITQGLVRHYGNGRRVPFCGNRDASGAS